MLDASLPPMPDYILSIVSRHSRLMHQIQGELGDAHVSPSQALLIMNLGNDTVKAGDLRRLGYYSGTNVSYNLNSLEEAGLITRANVKGDRRKRLVSLTPDGLSLCIHLRRKMAVKEMEAA